MQGHTQNFAFVVADHPENFRANKVRRDIKRHVLDDSRRKRKGIQRRPREKDEGLGTKSGYESDADSPSVAPSDRASDFTSESDRMSVLDFRESFPLRNSRARLPASTPPSVHPMMNRFRPLPGSKNRHVDHDTLLGHWWGSYGRCGPPKYLNFMISSDMTLSSYCLSAAVTRSLAIQQPARSLEYLTVRQYCIQTINAALQKPQWPVETIMSVKHLLFVDIYVGSTETLRSHVKGLEKLVAMRGGLEALPLEGEMSNFVRIHVLLTCVMANIRAPEAFIHADTPPVSFYDSITPSPQQFNESPLLWWSEHMSSLLESEYCTPGVHSLMCELRDLTRNLLEVGYVIPAEDNPTYLRILNSHSTSKVDAQTHFGSDLERRRVWIYESCRLAGLIYAAAIAHHVPISQACSKVEADLQASSIAEDLGSAMVKSEFYIDPQVWGELVSCYLWVAFVSAAVGHCNFDHLSGKEKEGAMLRRALMTQPATFSFLVFHDPVLAENAYKSIQVMLQVQELLDSKPTPIQDIPQSEEENALGSGRVRAGRPLEVLYKMTHVSCKRVDYEPDANSLPTRTKEEDST